MGNPRTNPESLPNIKRIDSKRTHGFQVVIVRQKKEHTKMFSDSVFGDKDVAREAAIIYRDTLLGQLPPSFTDLGIQSTTRSNTGHTGITFTFDRSSGTEGNKLPCFSVTARPEKGKIIGRTIFIGEKGYDEALKEAIKIRNEILLEREENILKAKNSNRGEVEHSTRP